MDELRDGWTVPGNYPSRSASLEELAAEFRRRSTADYTPTARRTVTLRIEASLDIDAPMRDQLDAIAAKVREAAATVRARAATRVPTTYHLVAALRAHDARMAGASMTEIAEVLFWHQRKPRRALEKALAIADAMLAGGYVKLERRRHFDVSARVSVV